MNTLLVDAAAVRDYLQLNATASASQYTDATIGSNILAAQSFLEQATQRYFLPRTFTTANPWVLTTELRPQFPIPGFRTVTNLTWGGNPLVANTSYWLVPDAQQTGVYTGVRLRAYRSNSGFPWWYGNPDWFDRNYDNPFNPLNLGGGWANVSMPNDLLIAGEAGYDPTLSYTDLGYPPFALLQAIKVLASFYTMRPASILADVAITPQGGVLNYSQMPREVADFIASWRAGQQAVSVG